ncbi:hypothetical protein LCGC14_1961520 [marine sediment metagenome]|uniref:Uncharacterized protein n=1 Tax=marine sediment metagenome TaxID=412755 RepID=A0A0F9FEG5_9ZZZZ
MEKNVEAALANVNIVIKATKMLPDEAVQLLGDIQILVGECQAAYDSRQAGLEDKGLVEEEGLKEELKEEE